MGEVIARDSRRDAKSCGNHYAQEGGSSPDQGGLTDENGHDAGKNCDQSGGGNARATVNSRQTCGKRNETGQRVDSKSETQPADQADAKHIEDECDDKPSGGSATKDMTLAPSTTTTAR